MDKPQESDFAELPVNSTILESFANEQSAYYQPEDEAVPSRSLDRFRDKLVWHINHSLSKRQKQVLRSFLAGRKERETARILGVTQQVVNIYKQRAIKRLHKLLAS
jgi:DNA-binding CsgD family transcriptional regulator